MTNGLDYFKKVYDEVPGWVQKMHDYSPDVLDHYTGIRGEVMQDGPVLSRKEKDVLIAAMNAARLYPRSMVYHTKSAVDHGLTLPELVEYMLTAYLYKGTDALATSIGAISYALQLNGTIVKQPEKLPETTAETLNVILAWLENEETPFIEDVVATVNSGNDQQVQDKILRDGYVSSRLKHLAMAGHYMVELRGADAEPWIEKARESGVKEKELAELGYLGILTAGIPAWFELSDALKRATNSDNGGES